MPRPSKKTVKNREYVKKHNDRLYEIGIRRYALYIPVEDADRIKAECRGLVEKKKGARKKPKKRTHITDEDIDRLELQDAEMRLSSEIDGISNALSVLREKGTMQDVENLLKSKAGELQDVEKRLKKSKKK